MWYVLIVSLMSTEEFLRKSVIILPPLKPTLEFYRAVIQGKAFYRSFFLSVAKASAGTIGSIIISSMAAYGVTKKHVKGMKAINLIVILTMFFSGGLIPTFLLYKFIGIFNTFWVMVLPSLMSAGNFVIMRNYFSFQVPVELEESALLDGANEVIIFFKIVVPVSVPMLSALSLFTAIGHWNDWYSYLIFCTDTRLRPFIELLRRVLINPNEYLRGLAEVTSNPGATFALPPASLKMTTIVIALLPIIIVYPFLQKYFVKGIMIGALKE